MNNLNSIIFEGKILSKPFFEGDKAFFDVESCRVYQNKEGETMTEKTLLPCVYSCNVPSYLTMLKVGRGVRLVGRISNYGDKVVLTVEHLEYKYKGEK